MLHLRGAWLGLLFLALPVLAQPKEVGEAFTFDPQSRTLEPARPAWWNVAVSPDGKTIVTAHGLERGGEFWIWDAETGQITSKISEPNTVRFVAFSPDGSLLATANFDNAVRIYDTKTWRLLAYGHQASGGHTARVNALAFNNDGSRLATAGLDKTARVWDVAEVLKRQRAKEGNQTVTMGPRVIIEGFEQGVFSVALSPDGKRIVTGGQDGSVRLWDLPAFRAGAAQRIALDKSTKLSGHGITVECVAFSRDGKRIASGSWDNTARLYDDAGKDIAVLKGHSRGVMAMAFSPDSSLLATASGDHAFPVAGEIRAWDAADGKERGLIGKQNDMALGVAFTNDGSRVFTTGRDRAVRIWDLAKRTEIKVLRPADSEADEAKIAHAIAYSPNGSFLAVAGEGGTIALWDVKARKRIAMLVGHSHVIHSLAWSGDNARLASASADRSAIIWDIASKKPLKTLTHPGSVYAVAFSNDGEKIATGGFDKVLRIWSGEKAEVEASREGHTASIRALAFSPDGKQLASAGSDFTVKLWNLSSNESIDLRGHSKAVRSIAFLGTSRLATAADDGFVRIWNSADREVIHTFGPYPDGALSIAASPRGSFVAVGLGNGRIHILDAAEGQTRAVLTGPTDGVAALAIAPDGRELAAGGFDRVIRLWSAGVKPSSPDAVFPHNSSVRAVAVTPNGSIIATATDDGTIALIDSATGEAKSNWKAHEGQIEDLSFSGDGVHLASAGIDKTAKVWRIADHKLVHSIPENIGPVRRIALNAKGTLLATASTDSDIRIHDLVGGTVKKLAADAPISALQFLADDSLLSGGGPRAYLWEVAGSRVLNTLDGGQFARITAVAGSADGKLIAIAGEPATGSQLTGDVGNCRVLAVSRYHATTGVQRLNDTGVGGNRLAVSPEGRIIALVGGDGTIRVWDWPALTPIRKFSSHHAAVLGLAISNRGEFVVTSSADGTAKRWNAARGEPLLYSAKLLDESKQAWFARVSPDGKVIATGGDDRVLRLRDALPGHFQKLPGDYKCIFSSAINKDGTILATGHLDGAIRLWDLKTRAEIKKLEGHAHRVWSIAFSADGTRMVSGGGNWDDNVTGEIRIWDTSTWKVVHEVGAHDDLVYAVALSPDNKMIASGSRDQTIRTWELATGKPIKTIRQNSQVRSLAFTKDGKRLYSCPPGGTLHWWNPMTGEHEGEHSFDAIAFERLKLSPDGKFLGVALKAGPKYYPAIWSVEKNEMVRQFKGEIAGQINDLAFSPDSKTLVAGGGHDLTNATYQVGPIGPWVRTRRVTQAGRTTNVYETVCEIKCWDVATGNPLAELPGHKQWLESVQFTPDGSTLITAGGVVGQPGEIRFWDTAGLRPKAALSGHGNSVTCGRFSPDGKRLATGSTDSTIIIWDVAKALAGDSNAKTVLKAHKGLVRSVAWNTPGDRLVSCAEDGVVIVWDPAKSEPVLTITAHDRPVYGVAFSPDGTMIASTAGDWKNRKKGEVRVWDAHKGTELFRRPDTEFTAWGAAFTSDGKLITAHLEETALRVYDPKTKQEVKTISSPTPPRGLAISGDGKYVGITSQSNGLIKLWQTAGWRESHELTGHPGKVVFTIDFASDNQTVLTAGGDGAVVIWKIPGGEYKLPEFVPPMPPRPPKMDAEQPLEKN